MNHQRKVSLFIWLLIVLVFSILCIVVVISTVQAGNEHRAHMPLVFDDGVYYDTPVPTATPTATPTKTPRPPDPTPTATATVTIGEGGSCVAVRGARRNVITGGILIDGLVPSVCSYMVIDHWQDHPAGNLLVVRAERIKIDTPGCEQGDFGPGVAWPPVDDPCPPVEPLVSEWGEILWGDIDLFNVERSAAIVCGYCEECGEPYTYNCVEVVK
jgi:hypothetical protein